MWQLKKSYLVQPWQSEVWSLYMCLRIYLSWCILNVVCFISNTLSHDFMIEKKQKTFHSPLHQRSLQCMTEWEIGDEKKKVTLKKMNTTFMHIKNHININTYPKWQSSENNTFSGSFKGHNNDVTI